MAEAKKVTGVAIYVRVSTDKQEADNQLYQLRDYCQKAGYPIYKEFVDVASGNDDDRPAFQQMFKDAGMRKFDMLLFWDLSRFSRAGIAYTIVMMQRLEEFGVSIHSFREPFISTMSAHREVVIAIIGGPHREGSGSSGWVE